MKIRITSNTQTPEPTNQQIPRNQFSSPVNVDQKRSEFHSDPAPIMASVASTTPVSKSQKPVDFSKLLQLQAWKESLDQQALQTKHKIWRVWEGLSGDSCSSYVNMSFSRVLDEWVKDLARNADAILNLHGAVECIKNTGQLDLNAIPKQSQPAQISQAAVISTHQQQHQQRSPMPPRVKPQPKQQQHVPSGMSGNLPHFGLPSPTSQQQQQQQQGISPIGVGNLSRTLRPLPSTLPALPQKRPLQPHTLMDAKRMKPM